MRPNNLFVFLTLLASSSIYGQTATGIKLPAEIATGKTYALVVGISSYEQVDQLKGADSNAITFYDYLRAINGKNMRADRISLLLNEKAKMFNIWRGISWLEKAVSTGDTAIIYFSGYNDHVSADEEFLLTWDAIKDEDPNRRLMTGALALFNLEARVRAIAARGAKIILITNTCRSGGCILDREKVEDQALPGGGSGKEQGTKSTRIF